MVVTTAKRAVDWISISKESLRAFIEFVTLFSTAFTPGFLRASQVIVDYHLKLLRFVSLFYNCLNHCSTFLKTIITVCCNKHIEWLILVSFFFIVNFALNWTLITWSTYLILRALTSDLNLTSAFLFEFLLSGTSWPDNLTYIIEGWIVRIWNENLLRPLWRFVVWWSLHPWLRSINTYNVSRIHLEYFKYESVSLLQISVLQTLISRVHPQPSLLVIDWLWTRWPNVLVVWLVVWDRYPPLEIIYSVSPY